MHFTTLIPFLLALASSSPTAHINKRAQWACSIETHVGLTPVLSPSPAAGTDNGPTFTSRNTCGAWIADANGKTTPITFTAIGGNKAACAKGNRMDFKTPTGKTASILYTQSLCNIGSGACAPKMYMQGVSGEIGNEYWGKTNKGLDFYVYDGFNIRGLGVVDGC